LQYDVISTCKEVVLKTRRENGWHAATVERLRSKFIALFKRSCKGVYAAHNAVVGLI
jgi:hypothetical protein